jgi:hypothetical protein
MAFVGNIIARVGANTTGLQRGLSQAQRNLGSFRNISSAAIRSAQTAIVASLATIGAAFAMVAKESTSQAMEYEAAVQRIAFMFGSSAKDILQFSQTTAKAFNLSRLEAVKYSAVYGNLLSSIAKDNNTLLTYTTDLLKASAVVASSTGKNMEEVMERIRSGLLGNTEAIEDLGINVNVAMIESTKAFQKFANGKSWDQLNFQTQQSIRYFAILEQANTKFGQSLYENTASGLQSVTAELKNASLNLGLAFLPAINAVMPMLKSFAEILTSITGTFMSFMNSLFGVKETAKSSVTAQNNLAGAMDKAGKKAKGSVAGFDEVNQLQESIAENSESIANNMNASGNTGGNLFEMPKVEIPESIKTFAAETKKLLTPLGEAFSDLWQSIKDVGSAIADLKNNPTMKDIFSVASTLAVDVMTGALKSLSGVLETLAGGINIVNGIMKGDFSTSLTGVEQLVSGLYKTFRGFLEPLKSTLLKDIITAMDEIVKKIGDGWQKIKEDAKKYNDPTKLEFKDFLDYFTDEAKILYKDLTKIMSDIWTSIKDTANKTWTRTKEIVSYIWEEIKLITWDDVKNKILTSWENLKIESGVKWEEFKLLMSTLWTNVKNFVGWDSIKTTIIKSWDDLKTETGTKWEEFKTFLSEEWTKVKDGTTWSIITDAILTTWETLKTKTGTIFTGIKETIKGLINDVIDKVNNFIRQINSTKISIPAVIVGGKTLFSGANLGFPNISEVPRLAQGGIISSPTLAMMGEAGTEAVVPLENTSFVDTLAGAIGTAVLSAMQFANVGNSNNSGSQRDIVINVDSTQLARIMIPAIDKENGRTGSKLIYQT